MPLFRLPPAPRLILMIGEDGFYVVPCHMKNAPEPFFVSRESHASVRSFLESHPRVPLWFIADTLAQDFRPETLPRLNPLDRPKLIERRLQQAFPDTALRAFYNTKDRTRVLLVALPDSSPVLTWQDQLAARCPEIGLLPLEGAGIVTALMPESASDWGLLITAQRTGGLRQIVTRHGELVFTRLTPPLTGQATEIANIMARDLRATLGYLSRLGLEDSKHLHTALVLSDALHPELRFINAPIPPPLLLSPHEAAQKLSLSVPPTESCADLLFAGYIARTARLKLPLMRTSLKREKKTSHRQTMGLRLAVLSMMLATGLAGWQASDGLATLMETQKESTRLATLQQQLQDKKAQAAPLTAPLGRLRQALARQRRFAEPTPTPWESLTLLQHGLGDDARVTKFEWKPADGLRAEIKLLTPDENREQILAHFHQLAAQLTTIAPHHDVTITRYPFPVSPQETLTNATATTTTAEITLREKAP